jgi:glutaminyl-tRNA synthetase
MGWKPVRVTYTSDYFDELYNLALELIKRGKAYVCHQSKADIEASRAIARAKLANPAAEGTPNSPWRDRSVEENLREFESMRKGKYAANEATLRMKMDMSSPNPNMWDQVAYRIK